MSEFSDLYARTLSLELCPGFSLTNLKQHLSMTGSTEYRKIKQKDAINYGNKNCQFISQ